MNAPPPSDLTVAVLAGGRGTRMGGVDKGWHLLGGRPLVEWALSALREQGLSNVLIVANRSHERYATLAPTIADAQSGFLGPLAGVASALGACPTGWLLTVPVDCPRPPRALARTLVAAFADPGCDAAVAHDGVRRQPLFAVYRRELAAAAANALARGLGVSAWQDSVALREVDFSASRAQFGNLNSLADVQAYTEDGGD